MNMNSFPISIGKKRSFGLDLVLNIFILLFAIVIVAVTSFNMRFSSFYVVGDSMLDTLVGARSYEDAYGKTVLYKGGDYVYVDKYVAPERGDIVVLRINGKYIIKRLIAFAGETVEIKRYNELYINDVLVNEPYVSYTHVDPNYVFKRTTVKEGCIFFLGDNREVSNDSRGAEYADTKAGCIVGVVAGWSLNMKDFVTGWNTFFNFTIYGRDRLIYN